ncbi:MAG: hypothetical protein AB9842_08120 [Bacteroidales bacterium]
MITQYLIPARLSGVKNPLVFAFQSDNIASVAGVAGIYYLDFSEEVALGQVLSLGWPAHGYVNFTSVANPDDSGTQLKAIGSETFNQWVEATVNYLNMNPFLSRDFIVEYAEITEYNVPVIFLTARFPGEAYELALGGENEALVTIEEYTAAVDSVIRENFKIGLQVWCFDPAGETYPVAKLISEINKSPDAYNRFIFNIADLIKFYKNNYYPWVTRTDIVLQLYYHVQPFLIRYWEEWGLPPEKRAIHSSVIHYALDGGLLKDKMVNLLDPNTFTSLHEVLDSNVMMLTFQPDVKRTDTLTPERLQIIYYGAFTSVDLVVNYKIFYTDGTDETLEYTLEELYVNLFDVYEVSVSYNTVLYLLEQQHANNKEIKSWQVWGFFPYGDGKKYTYELDHKYYPYVKRFLFHNSISGYDVVRFTGKASFDEKYDRLQIEGQSLTIYTGTPTQKTSFVTGNEMEVKANTGPLNAAELEHMKEILLSDEVYELDLVLNTARKIEIISDKVKIKEDGQSYFNMEITYRYVYPYNTILRDLSQRNIEGDFINHLIQ